MEAHKLWQSDALASWNVEWLAISAASSKYAGFLGIRWAIQTLPYEV